jgi:hypothetical protein
MNTSPLRLLLPVMLIACTAMRGAAADDKPMDIALGAKVFAEECWRCHETPDPATRDARAWRSISLHMRVFGGLSRLEQQQLLAFLRSQNTAKRPDASAPVAKP